MITRRGLFGALFLVPFVRKGPALSDLERLDAEIWRLGQAAWVEDEIRHIRAERARQRLAYERQVQEIHQMVDRINKLSVWPDA